MHAGIASWIILMFESLTRCYGAQPRHDDVGAGLSFPFDDCQLRKYFPCARARTRMVSRNSMHVV